MKYYILNRPWGRLKFVPIKLLLIINNCYKKEGILLSGTGEELIICYTGKTTGIHHEFGMLILWMYDNLDFYSSF